MFSMHTYTYRCSQVRVQGTDYKAGCWLCTGTKQNDTCSLPVFGKLQEIVLISCADESCKKIVLIVQTSVTLGFFRRAYGYVVQLDDPERHDCISVSCLKYYHPLNAILTDQGYIIKPKQDLHAL